MPKTIAVIDDESEMEFFYTQMLEDLTQNGEVDLHFFSDSQVFLNWAQSNEVDLLLTDINMPHLSGSELSQKLIEQGRHIPTYFVSGFDKADYKKLMQNLGICRFLEKPLDFDQLLLFIQQDLGLQ